MNAYIVTIAQVLYLDIYWPMKVGYLYILIILAEKV